MMLVQPTLRRCRNEDGLIVTPGRSVWRRGSRIVATVMLGFILCLTPLRAGEPPSTDGPWTDQSMGTLTGTCRVTVALPADVPTGFKPTWGLVNGVVYAYSVVFNGDRGGSFVVGMNDRWPGALERDALRSISVPVRSSLGLKGRIEEAEDEQHRTFLTWTSFHSSLGGVYFIRTTGMTWAETRRLVESLHFNATDEGQTYEWSADTAEILAATCRGRVALPARVPMDMRPVRTTVNRRKYAFSVEFAGTSGRFLEVAMADSSGGICQDPTGIPVVVRAVACQSGIDLPGTLVESRTDRHSWIAWSSRGGWPHYEVFGTGLSWSEMREVVTSLRYLPSASTSAEAEREQNWAFSSWEAQTCEEFFSDR